MYGPKGNAAGRSCGDISQAIIEPTHGVFLRPGSGGLVVPLSGLDKLQNRSQLARIQCFPEELLAFLIRLKALLD